MASHSGTRHMYDYKVNQLTVESPVRFQSVQGPGPGQYLPNKHNTSNLNKHAQGSTHIYIGRFAKPPP